MVAINQICPQGAKVQNPFEIKGLIAAKKKRSMAGNESNKGQRLEYLLEGCVFAIHRQNRNFIVNCKFKKILP
ncbi:MAG: hypothetical protein CVU06_04930 [Bacteroidetes bacterium HGW-Bacteroidetes-22]|nr:MAG: hypothetical protein CVU06_04930 [Bacteroidetes bacterium HGW-Bacteroidetes-22]